MSKKFYLKIISHAMLTVVKNWDQTKLEHNNHLTYLVKCPEKTCSENYLGDTARSINERVLKHAGKDKKSHMSRHTLQSGHPSVS